jgi:hypothetical protein
LVALLCSVSCFSYGTYVTYWENEKCGNARERDHFGDVGFQRKIIFKGTLDE